MYKKLNVSRGRNGCVRWMCQEWMCLEWVCKDSNIEIGNLRKREGPTGGRGERRGYEVGCEAKWVSSKPMALKIHRGAAHPTSK
jgi:hypothetical protein